MTDYIHDAALVADSASFQRAPNASITVYDADDATNAVPLVLKDLNGLPLANPLTSSQDAFTPAFITSSAQVKLVGGGLTVVLNSFQGLREDALAAQVEAQAAKTAAIGAQAAAETAGADAAEVAAAALAGAVEDAETAKVAAEAAAALVGAPADTAISTAINAPGSATRTALNATIGDQIAEQIPPLVAAAVGDEVGAAVPPAVAAAIAADGTVTAAAAAAVDDAVAAADLIEGTDSRIPAIVDNAEFLNVTVDQLGKISEGVRTNGRKFISQADITEAEVKTLHATNMSADLFTQAGQSVTQAGSNEYSKVTTDQNDRIAEDALDAGGRVPAWVLSAWAERMAPELKAVLGVAPALKLAAFGDSMTFGLNGGGTTWPATAAADLGWTHYNGGVSGQTSSEIALRQGGLEVLVTVTGNSIPASGPVTVTAISPSSDWRAGSAWSFLGTLAGVPGTLAKSASEVWTFTRTTNGSAVACIPNTRFLSAAASPHNGWVNVFWAGRNNLNKTIVLRDVAAMVASLTPIKTRFLVLPIFNATNEPSGSGGYNAVVDINNSLSTIYGANFYDMRRYLIDYGLAAAGIAPTGADTTAIAEDRIPPSLMSDSLHLTGPGYAVVGHRIAAIITEKSWNL